MLDCVGTPTATIATMCTRTRLLRK